jgi:MFS family permease
MTIYLRQRLEVPLTQVTLLMTINSVAGLTAVSIVGPLVDRFGRKRAMVLGLASIAAVRALMPLAGTLPAWAVLMVLMGACAPLYQVGADAMIADLIEPERRVSAYALLRTITNLAIAIGPAVGGFIATRSYTLAFYIAAGATAIYTLLIVGLTQETMPGKQAANEPGGAGEPPAGGYGPVLHDRRFMAFVGLYTLTSIAASIVMVLLPVYAKEQFGVPESQYGFIMATNAAMVVLFQYLVTQQTKRYAAGPVLAVGALFYAAGAGSIALGAGFAAFWLSMVVLTIGELLMSPTATALTATLAPPDMRGRYMGLFSLTWGVAYGLGPVLGAMLSDQIAPVATWYAGLAAGLASALGFMLMAPRLNKR